jgi:hypothetical protein
MASMPVPRIVFDKLIAALAIVALGSSKYTESPFVDEQIDESKVEFVSNGLCSSRDAPISEKMDNAGTEDMDEADVSFSIIEE